MNKGCSPCCTSDLGSAYLPLCSQGRAGYKAQNGPRKGCWPACGPMGMGPLGQLWKGLWEAPRVSLGMEYPCTQQEGVECLFNR